MTKSFSFNEHTLPALLALAFLSGQREAELVVHGVEERVGDPSVAIVRRVVFPRAAFGHNACGAERQRPVSVAEPGLLALTTLVYSHSQSQFR